MKRTIKTKPAASSVLTRAARATVGGVALSLSCLVASAQAGGTASDALERKFRQCDNAAATRLLDAGTAAECGAATDALRRQRFGGDFNAMLAWWRQGKSAAHRAIEAEAAAAGVQRVADPARSTGAPIDPLRRRLEALVASEIKQLYLQCSNQAIERRLDGSEAAMCSVAYEVLLKQHFGGNFEALLAWSRQQGNTVARSSVERDAVRTDQTTPLLRASRPARWL